MIRYLLLTLAVPALLATGLATGALAEEPAKNPLMAEGFFTDQTSVAEVQAVFDQGFGVDERGRYGDNPLHRAIEGHAPLDVLKLLIDKGAAVNQPPGKKGNLVTLYAAYAGDLQVLKLIDASGADWSAVDDVKSTPLHWLAYNEHPTTEMVDFILSEGVDPAAQTQTGDTAATEMGWSSAENAPEIYAYLLAKGSPDNGYNADGEDTFMKSVSYAGKGEWLEQLYQSSEDPQAANNEGLSGILLASRWGINNDRLDFLKAHGFDLFAESDKGENAIILHSEWGDTEGLKLLLDEGFDINSESDKGETPLLRALKPAQDFTAATVTAIVEAGGDVNHADARGVTPLMLLLAAKIEDPASEDGQARRAVFDLLIATGADLTAVDAAGASTLVYAIRGGQPVDRLKAILAAGVDVNAVDADGMTALMYAAASAQDPAVLELLLDAGADPSVKDVFDDAAAQYAADNAALAGSAVLGRL